jgi:hypothetical protein
MALTAEQHSQIAKVYDKAAADQMVPAPQRAAFARKAEWFRMLARIEAKKAATAASKKERPQEARPEAVRPLVETLPMKGAGR